MEPASRSNMNALSDSDIDLLNFINETCTPKAPDDKVQKFINAHKKKSTVRQTASAVKRLTRWLLTEKLEIRSLEEIPPQ